jgi:3-hydroxybutyryl-CoA dehydrogenase
MLTAAGKEHALVGDVSGFVCSRLQYALFHEAISIVQEGVASPADVDALVRSTFGRRLPFFGPFAVADMAGLDVYLACYASLQSHFGDRFATPPLLEELVKEGRVGAKAGGGFFPLSAEAQASLIDYRNRAFVEVGKLVDELGPRPL